MFDIGNPYFANEHDSFVNHKAYQEMDVSNPKNEGLYQMNDIDDSNACDDVLTNQLYGPADYIAGFIIYANGASGDIDILTGKDYCQ